jgi:hypothetical protein
MAGLASAAAKVAILVDLSEKSQPHYPIGGGGGIGSGRNSATATGQHLCDKN